MLGQERQKRKLLMQRPWAGEHGTYEKVTSRSLWLECRVGRVGVKKRDYEGQGPSSADAMPCRSFDFFQGVRRVRRIYEQNS